MKHYFFFLLAVLAYSCSSPTQETIENPPEDCCEDVQLEISLAEWSLHKSIFSGKIRHLDFPQVAKEQFGISAVEYVNQFFYDKAEDTLYLDSLKANCQKYGVKSVLIMVDNEGELAHEVDSLRQKAVERHKRWIHAAHYLGCDAVRVNLHGTTEELTWKAASTESLKALCDYASAFELNIIVENHGQLSGKANLLVELFQAVDRPNCGALPDFGNFCVRRRDGDLWESPCVEEYDPYLGVEELLPYAKGVSAKTLDFDAEGNESTMDFPRMMSLVKTSGYTGYVGLEFEGSDTFTEEEGILLSKDLIKKHLFNP